MTVNRKPMPTDFDDDAPGLATPYREKRAAKATVQRGRPKLENPKISTTIQLSPEVIPISRRVARAGKAA